jgi:hypothetical protein
MYTNVERKALLLSGKDKILPVKMDDSEIPISLRGIGYLNAKSETIETIAALAIDKLKLDASILKDSVSYLLANNKFEEAVAIGESYLSRAPESDVLETVQSAPVRGFMLYNTACCYSRMAKQDSQASRLYRDKLDKAVAYIDTWLRDPNLRSSHPVVESALEYLNSDDDLLFLRQKRVTHFTELFRELGYGRPVRTGATGNVSNCVGTTMTVETARGAVSAGEIKVGDPLIRIDARSREASVGTVKLVRVSDANYSIIINGTLEVSSSQSLYSRSSGWIPASEIVTGDQLLSRDGFVSVLTMKILSEPRKHLSLELEDDPHTFLCSGFVCHNVKMG